MKIGIGQDSHRFNKSPKPLVMGGVVIDNHLGLQGNSDGDVIIHSLCNALSSAIGGESISTWADPMCFDNKITDSRKYLEYIYKIVSKNYSIVNISIAIEAETPRLSIDQKAGIKKSLSSILEISHDQIGITYTSGEGLTAFGQKKGIQAFSLVNLQEK
jgi:2-C-methyl-D-erythritol 2,4-cyclodiphosphate synthase